MNLFKKCMLVLLGAVCLTAIGHAQTRTVRGTVTDENGEPIVGVFVLEQGTLYFIAAEAAVKGATGPMTARELLNVLRARAGKWEYKNNEAVPYVADFSKELTDATPQEITIDYLLDEKLRENFADGFRWFDLARTQTWHTRAAQYTIAGAAKDDHTPVTYTRTIEKYHYLRPIPKGQIDAMMMSDAEKEAYQNPGYVMN